MEYAFESASWLAAALMAGAIIKNRLQFLFQFEQCNLAKLCDKALSDGVITLEELNVISYIINYRKLMHGDALRWRYAERKHAIDAYLLADKMTILIAT